MEPIAIAFWRTVASLPALLAVLLVLGIRLPHNSDTWISATIGGLTLVAIPFGALSWGQMYVTSSMGGVLYGATPLVVALFSMLILREQRAGMCDIVGAMIGLAGVLILIGPNTLAGFNSLGLGQIITLAGPLSYAFGTVLLRRRPKEEALSLTAGIYLIGAVLLFIFAALVGASLKFPPASHHGYLLVLAGLGSVAPTLCMYIAVQWAGAMKAAFAMLMLPIFSIAYGWIFLLEIPSLTMLSGSGLIIAGCAVALCKRAPSSTQAARQPRD